MSSLDIRSGCWRAIKLTTLIVLQCVNRSAILLVACWPAKSPSSINTILRKLSIRCFSDSGEREQPMRATHACLAGLMHFHTIEEPFDHDHSVLALSQGAMQVEHHLGFCETCGQLVFGIGVVYRTACIRHQLTTLVVDGNDHAPAHQTRSGIVAGAEVSGRVHMEAALFQIPMSVIDRPQRKPQRNRLLYFFLNQLLVGRTSCPDRVECRPLYVEPFL